MQACLPSFSAWDQRHIAELERNVHQLLELAKNGDRHGDRLAVRSSGSVHFVKVDTIDWIEASRNYVKIHCGHEFYTMRETMAGMEARLDPEHFLRIHRSSLVNIERIRRIEPGIGTESMLVLDNGERLMVSRAYWRGRVKERLS